MREPSQPAPAQEQVAAAEEALQQGLSSGAKWFYWIAGLSVVNTVISIFQGGRQFVLGLAITMMVDEASRPEGSTSPATAPIVISLLIAGLFVLFGLQAVKGKMWAFVVGIGLYLIDGLIMALAQVWLGVAIHAYALYCLFRGFSALRGLNRLAALRTAVPGLSQVRTD